MAEAPLILIAPPQGRRARAFQASLQAQGRGPARVVSWLELMQDRVHLPEVVPNGALIKVDSPGECLATERELLRLGLNDLEPGWRRSEDPDSLDLEAGRLMPSRQWYLGLQSFFGLLRRQLAACAPHRLLLDCEEALIFFDKRLTQRRWQAAGLPVPRMLQDQPRNYAELCERLRSEGLDRVFLKLAHGSGGSGAVALHLARDRVRAISTVRALEGERGLSLYNSSRLQRYDSHEALAPIVDALCAEPLQIEAWIPKIAQAGRPLDLRRVMIGGQACHALVRLGKGPITNLHLRNERGDAQALRARLGARWQAIEANCVRAMACFPGSHYAGLDALIGSDGRHYLLEGNAFGDYHRGVFWQGLDVYATELSLAESAAKPALAEVGP